LLIVSLAGSLLGCSTACHVEIVHIPTPVPVPSDLVAYCVSEPSDGTVGSELARLSALVRCERGSKDGIKAWEKTLLAAPMSAQ